MVLAKRGRGRGGVRSLQPKEFIYAKSSRSMNHLDLDLGEQKFVH